MNDPLWRLPEVPAFDLASDDFEAGGALPVSARAAGASAPSGADRSPELHWSGQPAETRSYVLACFDPDAPTSSGYWHWSLRDVPGGLTALPAGAGDPDAGLTPACAVHGFTESRQQRYEGAAPPQGHGQHRYFFILSALSVAHLEVPADATPAVTSFMLREHLLARAVLMGTSESR